MTKGNTYERANLVTFNTVAAAAAYGSMTSHKTGTIDPFHQKLPGTSINLPVKRPIDL